MRFFIITLFLLPLTLFAQEMLWSSESVNEVTQREYDEALESYTKEKYAKEIEKARQEKLEKARQERERVRQEKLQSITLHGLMWQDDAEAKSIWENWSGAIEYCQNLSLLGYNDWRLPSKEELASIIDTSRKPTIKKEFRNVSSSDYWSSTTNGYDKNDAWGVGFSSGYVYYNGKDDSNYVRCVRAGQ